MPIEGERIIRKIVFRDNIAFFVSMIPADDPCAAGGTGWLMALNAATGAAPRFPVFDLNDDSVIDSEDVLTIGNPLEEGNPEGIANPIGREMLSIPNLPAFLYDDRPPTSATSSHSEPIRPGLPNRCRQVVYLYNQNQWQHCHDRGCTSADGCGRQSWFQTD